MSAVAIQPASHTAEEERLLWAWERYRRGLEPELQLREAVWGLLQNAFIAGAGAATADLLAEVERRKRKAAPSEP